MRNYAYASIFKQEMLDFAKLRQARGFLEDGIYVLERLDAYIASRNVPEKALTPTIVDGFIAYYSAGRSASTMTHYGSCCSQFAKYLNTLGIPAFVTEYIKPAQDYVPYIFSEAEMARIFEAADNMTVRGYTKRRIATRLQIPMLLRLLYGCGLRLGEALALRFCDVDFDAHILVILHAKGNKDRLVPMDESLTNLLKRYCAAAIPNCRNEQLLFESEKKGQPRHQASIDIRFKQIVHAAGIEVTDLNSNRTVCVHCLRHTFAVHSFRKQDKAGIDNYRATPSLSLYMGHDRLLETQRYLHNAAEITADVWEITSEIAKSIFPEVPQ